MVSVADQPVDSRTRGQGIRVIGVIDNGDVTAQFFELHASRHIASRTQSIRDIFRRCASRPGGSGSGSCIHDAVSSRQIQDNRHIAIRRMQRELLLLWRFDQVAVPEIVARPGTDQHLAFHAGQRLPLFMPELVGIDDADTAIDDTAV